MPLLPTSTLLREGARVAIAFFLYLFVLRQAWAAAGMVERYDSAVLSLAGRLFLPFQHFPIIEKVEEVPLRNLDFVVVLAIAFFLVSARVPWWTRARKFVGVIAAIYALHVTALVLQIKIESFISMNEQYGFQLLLPIEFKVVERLKFFFYDFGLQWQPCVLALLTVFWNTQGEPTARPRRPWLTRRRATIAAAAPFVAVIVLLGWGWWRERHPLHVDAHAVLGHIYYRHQNVQAADREFRAAIKRGTRVPQAYYLVALAESKAGNRNEARRLLQEGAKVTTDPQWKAELERTIVRLEHEGVSE